MLAVAWRRKKNPTVFLPVQSRSKKKWMGRLRIRLICLPGKEMKGIDKNSLILVNFHDFIGACSDLYWKRSVRESALHTKYRSETNWTQIVRCDSNIDPRTRIGDLGSVRIKLEWLEMGEVAPGKRKGGHPAHEGKSLCVIRLCIVLWDKRVNARNCNIEWGSRLSWFKDTQQYKEFDGLEFGSWPWKSSKIRQQCYRSESFARITDIHMSGLAIWRTTFQSWSRVYLWLPLHQAHQQLQHHYRRKV